MDISKVSRVSMALWCVYLSFTTTWGLFYSLLWLVAMSYFSIQNIALDRKIWILKRNIAIIEWKACNQFTYIDYYNGFLTEC